MALTRKGTLAFGIGTTTGGLAAPSGAAASDISAVISAEATDEFQVNATAKGADGEVSAHAYGDTKHSLRMEGYHSTAAIPSLGDDLTIAGKSGAVMRATIQASNEDFVKLSVEAEGFNAITYSTT